MKTVLYTDSGLNDVDIERNILAENGIQMIMASATDEETLIREGSNCDGIMVEYAQITEKILHAWAEVGCVKIVARQGIGYDNIDVESASKYGIMVGNVPDYCIDEVADHTLALALAAWRQLKFFDRKIDAGEFDESVDSPIHRIRGKSFCIYSFGNIGRQVALRAQAFGFNTYAYSPSVPDELFLKYNTRRIGSLKELAQIADIFTVHAALRASTKHSVDADVFACMKPTCVFVNTSRGSVIDEAALTEAILNGRISAAALDVYEEEPLPLTSQLRGHNNVILSPHMAFYSEEAEVELREKLAKNIAATLITGSPLYCVNRRDLGLI